MSAAVTCPKCGCFVQQGSKFCKKCGFSLEASSNIEHPTVQDETQEMYTTDFKPEPGATGTVMMQTVVVSCPGCNAPLQAGNRFCVVCGRKVAGSEDAFSPSYLEQNSSVTEGVDQNAKNIEGSSSKVFSLRKVLLLILAFIIVAVSGTAVFAFLQGYILDQESPEVAITFPAGNKTITLNASGDFTRDIIEIKAQDNRKLKKVDLLVNAVPVKSYENFGSMIYNWETNKEGEYIFYAVAQDYSGNTGKSASLVIKVKKPVSNPAKMSTNYPKEKQEVEAFINNWIETIKVRNLNEHMACYADNLEIFYTASNMSKSEIFKNRQEMFNTLSRIDMSIYNLQVSMGSSNSATATFNKKWDFSGKETFSGEVLQRISLKNIDGSRWQITGEEEIQILWAIRNGKKIE